MISRIVFDMDEKLLESYLEHIAEQIVDENKIVTYKSLSKSLGIHVNTAKQLLYVYLTKKRLKNAFPISATYLLAGKVVDGSFDITIVNEADLKKAYSGFVEVTSEHVYSVQKAKSLKDIKLLCGVDLDVSKPKSCDLVIKCSKAVLRLRKEVEKKAEVCEAESKRIIEKALVGEKQTVNTSEPKIKTSPKKTSPKSNSGKGQVIKRSAGNISSFFSKSVGSSEKLLQNDANNIAKNRKEVMSSKAETGISEKRSKSTETEKGASEKRSKSTEREKGASEKKNETKASFKKNKKGSKRKRIQMFSDSEESESNEDENVHVDVEEDPPLSVLKEEKEETVEVISRNKRKKRKVIDRTVMNEDGYLETKKEVVFETDSENEPEETAGLKDLKKPKETEKAKKAPGTNASKKQSTLFTFFKRT